MKLTALSPQLLKTGIPKEVHFQGGSYLVMVRTQILVIAFAAIVSFLQGTERKRDLEGTLSQVPHHLGHCCLSRR